MLVLESLQDVFKAKDDPALHIKYDGLVQDALEQVEFWADEVRACLLMPIDDTERVELADKYKRAAEEWYHTDFAKSPISDNFMVSRKYYELQDL